MLSKRMIFGVTLPDTAEDGDRFCILATGKTYTYDKGAWVSDDTPTQPLIQEQEEPALSKQPTSTKKPAPRKRSSKKSSS